MRQFFYLTFFIGFFLLPALVFSAAIYDNLTKDTVINVSNDAVDEQMGTGLSGEITSFTMKYGEVLSSQGRPGSSIKEYGDDSYSTACAVEDGGQGFAGQDIFSWRAESSALVDNSEITFLDDTTTSAWNNFFDFAPNCYYKHVWNTATGNYSAYGDSNDIIWTNLGDTSEYIEPNLNFDTRIEWIEPFDVNNQPFETTQYATTSSKTFDIEFEYYLDSSELSSDNTVLSYEICPALIPSADCSGATFVQTITADSLTTATTSFTATYAGLHHGYVSFFDTDTEIELFTSGNTFIVESTSTEPLLNQDYEAIEVQCTTGGFVENGICSVLVFLFYPDTSALNRFVELKDLLDTKVPFAYYDLLNTKLASTTATSSPFDDFSLSLATSSQFSLGNFTFIDWSHAKDIIGEDNLDTIAEWFVNIMWIAFGLYVLRRATTLAHSI